MSFSTLAFLFHLYIISAITLTSSSRPLTMYKKMSSWKFTNALLDYICKFIIFDFSGHCYCIWCILLWLCTVKIKTVLKGWKEKFWSLSFEVFLMCGDESSPPHQSAKRFLWNSYFCLLHSFLTQMLPLYLPEVWKTLSQWMDN